MSSSSISPVSTPFKTRAGITFGLATIYGCAGWWVSSRTPFVWFDYLFIAIGAVGFFIVEPACRRIPPSWLSRLNALGFVLTILFIVGFAVKLYIDVGP
jgi:hypothetical protein